MIGLARFRRTDLRRGDELRQRPGRVGNNPVPIYLDLRPITDLLGPPYFADPAVTARRQLRDRLAQNPKPKTSDMPLMRMFDASLSNLSCGAVALANTTPLTTQQQGQLGPFVTGRRYGRLNPPTPAPTMDAIFTTATMVNATIATACPTEALRVLVGAS
jgi:hypothetical protein